MMGNQVAQALCWIGRHCSGGVRGAELVAGPKWRGLGGADRASLGNLGLSLERGNSFPAPVSPLTHVQHPTCILPARLNPP